MSKVQDSWGLGLAAFGSGAVRRAWVLLGATGLITLGISSPAHAQAEGEAAQDERRAVSVQPYIEVSQVLTAELSPGSDVLTFTQIAAGVDVNAQGRNSGISTSLRYERNISYGDNQVDSDRITGIARGYVAIDPSVQFDAGALASTTRIDGGGGFSANPLARDDNATSQIYSVFAGPSLNRRLGAVDVTGFTRLGYNRFESNSAIVDPDGNPIDIFEDSTTLNSQLSASTRPGDLLPVGIGVAAGAFQEDISNLDQRVRDVFVRGNVTVPVTASLAITGGVGYEDVEVSSRDALRDVNGDPILDNRGRFVTDESGPRVLAFDVDGLLWDVGVLWRPSSRTSLAASVGRRYDSTTYYGNFTYSPDARSSVSVNVYDAVSGFGGGLNNGLASLSSDFSAIRNPVTGNFGGLVTGAGGPGAVGALGSIRSAAFRGRGVNASYQRQIGRWNAGFTIGYDNREFIGAPGTVLESLDGVTDESYYALASLNRQLGNSGRLTANTYYNRFESGTNSGDVNSAGASFGYTRFITSKLSARGAVALDYVDSEFAQSDFLFASALAGLRYDF
ncbi:MAG: preprotein translocase subunit YajC [Pseudomonadota bacterium]